MFDSEDAGIEEYLRPSELIGLNWMLVVGAEGYHSIVFHSEASPLTSCYCKCKFC